MKYSAYPKYKPSGVEWLSEVPEHWEVKRLKFLANRSDQKIETEEDVALRYIGLEHIESWTGKILPLNDELAPIGISNRFRRGNVLFGKLRPYLAKACNPDFDGLCSTEVVVLQPRGHQQRYLLYQLLSQGFVSLVDSSTYGAKMPRASWEFIGSCALPSPSPSEQRAIADFLDKETARLDTLVAKKQELIEKLKEKRTALISRTVTRGLPPEAARAVGLDPHPKLKPSGIEWLGEVPEHWDVKMIKRTWSVCEYGISESLSGDGPIRVLTMGNIQDGKVILPEDGCLETVTNSMLLKRNDLLFNRTNSLVHVGKVGLFDGDESLEVTFASYLVRIRVNDQMIPQFLAYYLNIPQLLDFARSLALPSINQANLNPTRYGQIKIAVPPLPEQRAIADYLDRETAKIDQMVAKVEEALSRLQEYRAALITAAVTGKIDVRETE